MIDRRRSPLNVKVRLDAVEAAPPVAAAEVVGAGLRDALGARDVSSLIADDSGRSLIRRMVGREARRRRLHPFLDEPGPIAIAHRGGVEDAPANTLEAFAAAVALGYRYLETDAQVTRDGVVVAFHDLRLDGTTDRTGAIGGLHYAEVAAADAGFRWTPDGGRSFPLRGGGARIPRLEELLRLAGLRVNIDPKTSACVEPLVALVDRLDAWDRVGFGSFSDRRLRRIRELSRGRACTSMGPQAVLVARAAVAATGRMPRRHADCLQVPLRAGPVALVTADLVRAAHRAGLPVHVWTVNDEKTMHHVLDLGVDGVMTDRPRLLLDVLRERGCPPAPPLGGA